MERRLNPPTGDYSWVNGSWENAPRDGIENSVYLRLKTPRGYYWANPQLGSRLHLLQREKDLPHAERLAREYAAEALAPMVKDGRLINPAYTTQRKDGQLWLLIEATKKDLSPLRIFYPVPVAL